MLVPVDYGGLVCFAHKYLASLVQGGWDRTPIKFDRHLEVDRKSEKKQTFRGDRIFLQSTANFC